MTRVWRQRLLALAGVVCLWLAAEGGGPHPLALAGVPIAPMDTDVQFGLFAVGVALVAWGLAQQTPPDRFTPSRPLPVRSATGLVLLALTLFGFALRVVNLENAVHLFVDEMHFAEGVSWLRDVPNESLFTPMGEIAAFSWLHAYLQMHSTAVFGSTLTGLRMVSAVAGALTIPAAYLLARHLFDHRAGLLAALVLATFPPHVHMSRLALNNVVDPLFGTLALGLLVAGVRGGRRADFVLAGVCLGLTQYWYEGGKLVFPLAALVVASAYLLPQRAQSTPPLRRRFGQIGLAVLAFALVAAPGYYVLATWGEPAVPRLADMRLGTSYWEALLVGEGGAALLADYWREQVAPALLHFVSHPDGGAFYYGGHTALVLPHLVPFLLLGIGVAVWRGGAGGRALMLVLALTVFGNSLLTEPDWTARFAVTFPVLAVLIAAGIAGPYPESLSLRARDLKERLGERISFFPLAQRVTVVTIIVLAVVVVPVVYYFGPHLATYNQQIRPFYDHQDVGWRAADFPPGTKTYLLTDDLTYFPHIEGMERFWEVEIDAEFVPPELFLMRGVRALPRGRDIAFFVKPDDRETLHYLARVFDLPEPQFSPYNVPQAKQYALFYIAVN